MDNDFHLGHLVRDELSRQKQTVAWFARQINCERTTCYDIFERRLINAEQLEKISIALRRNFFRDLAEFEETIIKSVVENPR